ncbi:MAG: PD-(D/E)XK nuclease family protein, partial [Clostridia bacterium]|nr:PD-(D/E)XK nuclease family protein [Clostridia bacterium]
PSSAISALLNGQDKLIIHKGTPSEFVLRVFPVITDAIEATTTTFYTAPHNVDESSVRNISQYLDYVYPHTPSTAIASKNTVTGLLHANVEPNTNFTNTPISFDVSENIPQDAPVSVDAQLGTLYHRVMQIIDFDLDSVEQIHDFCSKYFTTDELNQIDCHKILSCIRFVRPMIMDADAIYREQPFLMYVPYCELVDSDILDRVLVQGVVDLIILKGDEAIIIDYKMTTITDPAVLASKYRLQLHCYQKSVQSALKCRVKSKILYSFLQEMQIIV